MRALSLKYRISGTIFLLEAVVLTIVLGSTLASYYQQSRSQWEREENVILELLSDFAREALLTREYERLQPHLEKITDNGHVISVGLYDESDNLVASNNIAISSGLEAIGDTTGNTKADTYWRFREIANSAGAYGKLAIQFSRKPLTSFHEYTRNRGIFMALLGMSLIAVFAVLAGHILTRRLNVVADSANAFAAGRFDAKTRLTGSDEISHLGMAFDRMADSIISIQQILRDQGEHIKLLMDSTAEAIYGIDAAGKCTFVNDACVRMLGYAVPADLIGKSMHPLIHHSHSNRQVYAEQECKIQKVIGTGKGVHVDDEVLWRADGSYFNVDYWSYPIRKDAAIIGAVVTFIDTTERRSAEQALKQSEMKLRSITENTPDHVMLLDLQGTILFINHTVQGLTKEQVLNTSIFEYLTQAYRVTMQECFDKVLASGRVDQFEAIYYGLDGSVDYFESRVGPVFDENRRVAGFTVSARNVTERKKVELELQKHREKLEDIVKERTTELLNSNKELEAFSYSVSHDLRSPLRAIDGFSKLLLDEYESKLDPAAQDYLYRIRNGCQRMGRLIDDLLSLAKVSRYQLQRETVNLSETAYHITQQLQESSPHRRVEFIVARDLTADADPRLIGIVLENLLGNAWKYTNKIPAAQIEFGATNKDGINTYFVRDNGAGFEMQYVEKLFKVFQRLHTDSEFPGSGVGLATVERIIQRHGGKVWAESAPDKGATFYFTLETLCKAPQ